MRKGQINLNQDVSGKALWDETRLSWDFERQTVCTKILQTDKRMTRKLAA